MGSTKIKNGNVVPEREYKGENLMASSIVSVLTYNEKKNNPGRGYTFAGVICGRVEHQGSFGFGLCKRCNCKCQREGREL